MATIVLHKPTGKHYVLIGTGFGAFSSRSSSFLGGDLFPNEEYGEIQTAALSDAEGCIIWLPTENLQVLKVDGKHPGEFLEQSLSETAAFNESCEDELSGERKGDQPPIVYEQCPACGHRVLADVQQCPSCELTLISKEPE